MPIRLDAIVLSTQHDEKVTMDKLRKDIKKHVLDEVLPANLMDSETKIYINPTGRFVIGGPHGDSGLTGRKIIVDTYGGYARHGGGHFLERIVPWTGLLPMQPVMWQNIVAAGLANEIHFLMQLSGRTNFSNGRYFVQASCQMKSLWLLLESILIFVQQVSLRCLTLGDQFIKRQAMDILVEKIRILHGRK